MRAKRSKDTRLVDKFSKHKEDVAADSRLHQPVKATTADDDYTDNMDQEEDDDLKVGDCNALIETLFWFFLGWDLHIREPVLTFK